MKGNKITISKVDMKVINAFVDRRCKENQSLYTKRGSFKRDDILVGAMGEMGVYLFLRKHGFKVSKPDFAIYDKNFKSYDADLQDEKRFFHVKSQTTGSAFRFGHSWLLQRNDKIVQQGVINNYIVPTCVDLNKREVEIFGIVSTITLHKWGCFSECTLPAWRHSKVAIYLDSLKGLSRNALWGAIRSKNRPSRRDRNDS